MGKHNKKAKAVSNQEASGAKTEVIGILKAKSRWETASQIATVVLAIVTIPSIIAGVIFGILNYGKLVDSVEWTAQNTELTAENTKLTAKNMELTHEPIVFVEGTIIPETEEDNPFKHFFVLTNLGKIPARDVQVSCTLDMMSPDLPGWEFRKNTVSFPVLGQASIYPNSQLVFQIPAERLISFSLTSEEPLEIKWNKAQAVFTIMYSSEASENESSETMKFIYSEDTNQTWQYVGPLVDIFAEE